MNFSRNPTKEVLHKLLLAFLEEFPYDSFIYSSRDLFKRVYWDFHRDSIERSSETSLRLLQKRQKGISSGVSARDLNHRSSMKFHRNSYGNLNEKLMETPPVISWELISGILSDTSIFFLKLLLQFKKYLLEFLQRLLRDLFLIFLHVFSGALQKNSHKMKEFLNTSLKDFLQKFRKGCLRLIFS